jgi:hypothetical protein
MVFNYLIQLKLGIAKSFEILLVFFWNHVCILKFSINFVSHTLELLSFLIIFLMCGALGGQCSFIL